MHAVAASSARSAPYGYVIVGWILCSASSGNWCVERTFVICRMHFMHAVAASGARSAPYGYVIGRMHFMHAVAAIGGRSAPLLFVGCILCMQ
jgi:hypothetical protein